MKLWLSVLIIIVIVAGSIIVIRRTVPAKATMPSMATTNSNNSMQKTEVQKGDTITVNYTGKLTNGTAFDSNVDPKFNHVEPFTFVVGAGMVIKGWDEGFIGMKVGEKKTLTIPPEKAYGAQSPSPLIPANSTLVFDVELVSIK